MTREAKIGLLVALAFILVIGILLSDHVTSATRPPTAPLALIEGAIRGGITTPGTTPPPALQNPPRLPGEAPAEQSVPYVHNSAPQQARGHQGDVIVGLGTPEQAEQPSPPQVEHSGQVAEGIAGAADPWLEAPTPGGPADQQQAQPPAPYQPVAGAGEHPLAREAQLYGETLVPANPRGASDSGAGGASAMAGVKEYTIQPGDSLSKIVARHLGRYTPANEAVLLSLNPKLKADKDRIIVGEKLLVPATAAAVEQLRAASSSSAESSAGEPRSGQARAAARRQAPAGREAPADRGQPASASRTYVVKHGDTLWSIATKQLGSGARHKEILALNAEKLPGPDELQVGMRLRLPA